MCPRKTDRFSGFALRGEVLFKRLKSTQKLAGDTAENTAVFSMAFSPDLLKRELAALRLSGVAKFVSLTTMPVADLKSALFYGGYLNAHRLYGKT